MNIEKLLKELILYLTGAMSIVLYATLKYEFTGVWYIIPLFIAATIMARSISITSSK